MKIMPPLLVKTAMGPTLSTREAFLRLAANSPAAPVIMAPCMPALMASTG